ncbi:cadherin-like domain-containing protein [Curvibacter sp. CHRR-16]|uniref:cadherin-like domain-containing protein n=1 Tax=Curvibacter sp. CHRR-16 TaxID=2835872 RepID=UPI001BDA379F|nr:cadherin-like domain-containing protein [Curvibacter sp. CHRR-16]MBT0569089.1 cadherin-like domain-containing protein [Curvibacter sp. CHRR-16]
MAEDKNNPFAGIKFDLSKLSAVSAPANLTQGITVPSLPVKQPDTWTPLGSFDSVNAGIEQTASKLPSNVWHSRPVEALTGRLGVANDGIAVVQHLIQGRMEDAAIEFGGVVGQGGGAAIGYGVTSLVVGTTPTGTALKFGVATFGAYIGSNTGKDLTASAINALDTTAPLAPGQVVQQVATLGGQRYGLGVTVDGKRDWYRIDTYEGDTRSSFGQHSGAVVALTASERIALTDQLAKSTFSASDYEQYQRMVNEIRTQGDISENINPRIRPVGSVYMADDSAEASADAPEPSYFNRDTALPTAPASDSSTPNYVVQSGDTVSAIAHKLGLTPQQYGDYLKSVYGPDADLNSIVAGRELPVPADAPYAGSTPSIRSSPDIEAPSADNDYKPGSSNGEAEAAAYKQLVDAFNNATTNPDTSPVGEGVQLADASNGEVVSDAGPGYTVGGATTEPTTTTDSSLPEDYSGSDAHFSHQPEPTTQAPYVQHGSGYNAALQPYLATLSLLQGLDGLQHWDKMDDLGHFNSLLGLANNINSLSEGSLGNLGTLNTLSSSIGLIQNIENHNLLGTLSSINGLSDQAVDAALNNALGSTGVPYVGIALALNDFEHHPGQSIGSLVGMYFGPVGSALGGMIGGMLDQAGVFGGKEAPPPPDGATHYEWDAEGNIQIHIDRNQSQGGEIAKSTAQSVQSLLQSIVQSINDQTVDTSDNVAINPYLLPKVGYSGGDAWIEITTPDGDSYRETIQSENLAQRLFEILTENGGIAPVWQVQTQMGHMQQLLEQGASQAQIAAELGAGAGGHAYQGNQAYALEGNATESADFKSQSFGALVVHLGTGAVQASTQALQSLQEQQTQNRVATSELYRDTEGDGYFEKTEWVSATDAQGNLQGMLVLDYNGNGQIETRDILNLGGNAGQEGNNAADAQAASANAHLQRNNVQWLDANGDGVLDKSDPAFAAIRLWVDVNQDAQLDEGEQISLDSLQITSINFSSGQVTYADGHSDALSSTTLKSDTEGVRYTQMQEADAQGKLHTIDAGQMLEHEGYQGQVQVTDQPGVTRWGSVREATFEHNALRTGDWEGTAEEDQHRHGGANVASAPTQTSATGAVSLGEVKRANGASASVLSPQRVVFVPSTALLGNERVDSATAQMVRSAEESSLLGGGMGAGLGALALVGVGAVQTTAFAAERVFADYVPDNERVRIPEQGMQVLDARHAGLLGSVLSPAVETVQGAVLNGSWQDEPRQVVDAPPPPGVLADADALQRTGLDLSAYTATQTPLREMRAVLVSSGAATVEPAANTVADSPSGNTEVLLDMPIVSGEVLSGSEDTVLRMDTALLLANDRTSNADAALHISEVGNATHGQVSLQTSVDSAGQIVTEVVFLPDPDYFGTASFSYTVTDAYGLSTTATATLQVQNVNDAPYAQGEVVSGASEDAAFMIDKAVLLANDGDVDDPASALGIGWVGNAVNGTVSLDANGNVVFVPGTNFNGNAEFEYRTVDAAGLLSPVVPVVMPVAAVNDAPLAVDDQFQTYTNSTMTIGFTQLLSNDSDVENDTLSLVNVGNASHGVVSIVNGQVEFVPTAGFKGTASFDYLADDGNGGQTWATAFVEVKAPPNLYPTITLSAGHTYQVWYGNSAYYNAVEIWQNFSFSINDESPGSVTMSITPIGGGSVLATPVSVGPFGSKTPINLGSNAFQYNLYDGWGADGEQIRFDITLTDGNGLVNVAHVFASYDLGVIGAPLRSFNVTHEHTGLFVSPVLLDLMGDGLTYQSVTQSNVQFDVDHDGVLDQMAWVGTEDGVLAWDKNQDGIVSDVSEFSFQHLKEGAQTDLEGLQVLDTNQNGVLDAGDANFAEFGVWRDENGNGVTDAGEFKSLTEWGIMSVNLHSNGQSHQEGTTLANSATGQTDVTVMGDTTFTRTDGSTGVAADAMLAYQSGVHAQAAEADLARMALLFNQMANTAVTPDVEPLGFVPTQPHEVVVVHEEQQALQAA